MEQQVGRLAGHARAVVGHGGNDGFDRLLADLGMLTPAQQTAFLNHRSAVAGVVAAGPAAFDQDAAVALLVATSGVVNDILDTGACDGYLDGP